MGTPQLVVIAAVARDGVIGVDNRLPWHLPEDLRHFKELTTGRAVVMGRRTWESLPERFRPLPGRHNIVVTSDGGYRADGATVADSLPAALAAAGQGETFVIGGAQLYTAALPLADRLELTEIDAAFAGDAHFPAYDRSAWREIARESHRSGAGFDYSFATYERVR